MSTSPSPIPPAFPMIHPPAVRSTLPFSWFVALPSITPNSNSLLTFASLDFVCVQHIPRPLGNAFLVYTKCDVLVPRLPQAPHFFFHLLVCS